MAAGRAGEAPSGRGPHWGHDPATGRPYGSSVPRPRPDSPFPSSGGDMLRDRRIVYGVTGSIAAYKAADVVSKLQQAGALVDVVLTERAAEFVRPLTFAALSHRPVYADLWEPTGEAAARHIELGAAAELLVVAPATASAIARLAAGLADDMLGAVALATTAPLLLAPAMESHMY